MYHRYFYIFMFAARDNMNMSVSGIIGILTVVALAVGLVGWGAYAYRNPHSASGQMLIRVREMIIRAFKLEENTNTKRRVIAGLLFLAHCSFLSSSRISRLKFDSTKIIGKLIIKIN